jgi:hypothetical protein
MRERYGSGPRRDKMKTRIYIINYTMAEIKQAHNPEYFMSLEKAKEALTGHGYHEISAEDFENNIMAKWESGANRFFAAPFFAYIGFIEAEV